MNHFNHIDSLPHRHRLTCDPVSILAGTSIAASAGGGISSIIGQNTSRQLSKGAEGRLRLAVEDQIIQNRRRATDDYLRQVSGEQLRQRQEEEASVEKSHDISQGAKQASSTSIASAAERGVSGRTVEQIVSDYQLQEDKEIGRIRTNQQFANQQHRENLAGYRSQFDQRVSSIQPYVPAVQAPVDYFSPIFGILGTTARTGLTAKWGSEASTTGSGNGVKPASGLKPGPFLDLGFGWSSPSGSKAN